MESVFKFVEPTQEAAPQGLMVNLRSANTAYTWEAERINN